MSSLNASHDEKVRAVRDRLIGEGYKVLVEPAPEDLPFDLGGYSPDLVAERNDDRLVVEVKESRTRLPIERLRSVSETLKNNGWRFVLITLDSDAETSPVGQYPRWGEIRQRLDQIGPLLQSNLLDPAVLYLWSIFELAMKKRAETQNIPVTNLPPGNIFNHLYSLGEISVQDYDQLKSLLNARNQVAHGAGSNQKPEAELIKDYELVSRYLASWSEDVLTP